MRGFCASTRAAPRRVDGVHLVLTGKDFPISYGILPVSQDEHALATDRVRFVGDPVAAVIARDELTAFEALDLIDVEYAPLPTFATMDESLALDGTGEDDEARASTTTAITGNIHKAVSLAFGDVDRAFADADLVFEDTFFYQGNTHLPIEQHAAVAAKDPDGKLVLWSSTQTPHYVHRALAKALAMPAAHIRVIATPNGGGFGGKSDPFNHEVVVCKAALLLDRPVKICLTREEVFYCHRGRHPVLMHFKTGVKRDGSITGVHLKTLLDGGAYGSYGVASTFYTGALQTVTYHIPTYHFQGCRVFTNKPPCGPKRGHGTPQSRFGQEIQIDKIAEALVARSGGDAAADRGATGHAHGELPPRGHHRPHRMHPSPRRHLGLEEPVPQAAARPRRRHRVLVVPLGRGPADLLERHAALRRAVEARSQRRRHGVLRRHRNRAGIRRRAGRRASRRSSASIRSTSGR